MTLKSVQSLLPDLGAAAEAVRHAAAAALFEIGKRSAEAAIAGWIRIPELASLLYAPELGVTVGLAVNRQLFLRIHSANGAPPLAKMPPDQDAEEFELSFEPDISLDVLTAEQPHGSGPIARYLARYGEGIQQVEFRCRNVGRATEILRAELNLTAVYLEPRRGANGTRINFFLAAAPAGGKILIELYEPAKF